MEIQSVARNDKGTSTSTNGCLGGITCVGAGKKNLMS
jgi:hypothetical protein